MPLGSGSSALRNGTAGAYQWGELAGTQAEIAWNQGRLEDSQHYTDTAVQCLDDVMAALLGFADDTLRVAIVIKAIDMASRATSRSVNLLNATIRRFRALNASHLY